ncbi:MAG TPA: hypothetical protein VFQ67_16185 [Allosphingosinicella sp.]|jgi:hypothetical protein|nr:hypothetical protein [Allosphingosinicella sp.]
MAERGAARARRWLQAAFIAAVGAGLVYGAWGWWHDRRLGERFTRIQLGMDRETVEAVLGPPRWEGTCSGYGGYLPRAECVRELGYASAFAPIRPVYYMVQLDGSGKAIEAEPIRSR